MGNQQNLYTLAKASELTGLSTEALRLRIKRGKLTSEKGNDGQPRVRLTSAELEDFARMLAQRKPTLTQQETDNSNAVKVLEAAVKVLREQSERERTALGSEMATLREALKQEQTKADMAKVEAIRERDRAEGALIRAAASEAEAKTLREALEAARRPFWRRWIG